MAKNKKNPRSNTNKQPSAISTISKFILLAFVWFFILLAAGVIAAGSIAAVAYATGQKNIPNVAKLKDYEPSIPLRIFTADGVLIGEYGTEKRDFTPINEIPQLLKDSLLAIEDTAFYKHNGVNFKGLVRATINELISGGSGSQGASTIDMQLARTFFFSREKSYVRKFYEILTALRIDQVLTKDEILELYMNQIYLGHRSYGFAAAARTYFDKNLDELTLAEAAMLAGIPKAPATDNPRTNFAKAKTRQETVLKRMLEINYITPEQYKQAIAEVIQLRQPKPLELQLHAEYAADEAQQAILSHFNSSAYTQGLNVYTTIHSDHQKVAYQALQKGLIAYDKRHFYRGPEGRITLPFTPQELALVVADILQQFPDNDELKTAIVLSVSPKEVIVTRDGKETITIKGKGLEPVQTGLAANAKPEIKIESGSIIRIHQRDENNWDITQIPEVEGSLISMDPQTGAIYAMVGGFDYERSKFNHSTQAWRQPGSSFKTFVYSAALERGITPNTTMNDAPIVVHLPSGSWMPKNFGGNFAGRIPMSTAFAQSRNIPAILTIDAISPDYARQWISRFGFSPEKHPANLTMVLGSGSVTPLQMTAAYAVFANGGYQVDPFLIDRITDSKGSVIYQHNTTLPTSEKRIIPARNAFVMDTLLRKSGSAANRALGRNDLYGKTGTTNDSRDAWFVGFHPSLVASVWVGFDQPKSLGNREIGGSVALPIWANYMKAPLNGVPNATLGKVNGVSAVSGNWVYDEFSGAAGVQILGDELSPNPEDIPEITPQEQGGITNLFL